MDGPGKQLLAHTGLALDQYGNRFVEDLARFVGRAAPAGIAAIERGQGVAHIGTGASGGRGTSRTNQSGIKADLGKYFTPVRAQQQGLPRAAHLVGQQALGRGIQDLLQTRAPQVRGTQAQPTQRSAVGTHHPAIFRHCQDTFGDRTNALGLWVHMQANTAATACHDHAVLDHAGGGTHEPQGVWMPATLVARHIENAQQLTGGRDDGRRSAGQKTIALQKVFTPVDFHCTGLGQCSANRVGTAVVLMPRSSTRQSHALGPAQKFGRPQGVHEHALAVGQHHDALAVANLFKQIIHDGTGMRQQFMVCRQRVAQGIGVEVVNGRYTRGGRKACGQTATPRTRQTFVHHARQALAVRQQVGTCLP